MGKKSRGKRQKRPWDGNNVAMSVGDLMKLAAEPVPRGSGQRVYGWGDYAYLKANRFDGSTRILYFPDREQAETAIAIGVAADARKGECALA